MNGELVFDVTQLAEADGGGYCAECALDGEGGSIITEADSLDKLRANVREAVECHLGDRPENLGLSIRLRLVTGGGKDSSKKHTD
jgi:hypothetical protein